MGPSIPIYPRADAEPYDLVMVDIETGVLPAGHPYARIGSGSRTVLYLPGLSFTAEPATVASTRRSWKRWLDIIDGHDLTFVQVGRRADLSPGSTAPDVADDYAAVIREQWGSAVGVMGISTGGHYAQWLAIRHPDLVERLVLGFTAHRVPDDVKVRQRRAVNHFLAGRWRQGWALFGPWALPRFPRMASAALWLVGPYVGGRYSDLRVLAIDADSDDAHDFDRPAGRDPLPDASRIRRPRHRLSARRYPRARRRAPERPAHRVREGESSRAGQGLRRGRVRVPGRLRSDGPYGAGGGVVSAS